MFLHVKQWMVMGHFSSIHSSATAAHLPVTISDSPAPHRLKYVGRESTTASSVQMKNITRAVLIEVAPQGRQLGHSSAS